MPILRIKEIREMDSEERLRRLMELKAEYMRLKTMARAGGALDNPSRLREIRRTIARILTVENEARRAEKG